jgi:hypothetical protein
VNSVGIFLTIFLILAIGAMQLAFFIWVARQMKKQFVPLSPAKYRLICFGIAGVLFAVSLGSSIYTAALLTTGVKTTGVIVEIREREDKEDHSKSFAPTFTFVDGSGLTNSVESNLSYGSVDHYRIGERVPVIYRSSNPQSARIDSFAEHWLLPIMTFGFAAVVLISIPIRNKWLEFRTGNKQAPTRSQLGRL